MNFNLYNPNEVLDTKYLFFTGKGGVGKTTSACATAIQLADNGRRVMLVSTDPASNLQDVFQLYESMRLADDLDRANMAHSWWVINQSLLATHTNNPILASRANNETAWINKVDQLSAGQYNVISWQA